MQLRRSELNRTRARALCVILCAMPAAWAEPFAPVHAPLASRQDLTVEDLLQLKALGFTDDQLLAEVRKGGKPPRPSDADVERLRSAGVGPALIEALRGQDAPAAAALDRDGVLAMWKGGKGVNETLVAMQASGRAFEATPTEAIGLLRQGVPRAIVLALTGRPLTAASVRTLLDDGLDAPAWNALLALLGAEAGELPAAEALALVRGGVPQPVVGALRTGAAAIRTGAAGEARTGEAAPPVNGTGEAAAPQPGAGARKPRNPALTAPTPPTAPGVYRDVAAQFELRYPPEWHLLRSIDNDALTYWLTPEAGVANPDDLRVCLQVATMPVPDASMLRGKDAKSLLEHLLPLMRQWEPGLVPEGEITATRLGGLPAAATTLRGTTRLGARPVAIRAHVAQSGDLIFFAGAETPDGREGEYDAAFAKILADSTFGRPAPVRRENSLEARHVVQEFKASVVSVVAESASGTSTGTGFLITEDGYLLTNHHVIWDGQANKACDRFFVEWDDSLGRRRADAKLVDYEFELGAYARFHGTDVALLKIEGGPYKPMPLTPLAGVQGGDSVVTLGFPSRDKLAGVSLTITTGVVTRMNRGPEGEVETIYTDAAITHGSSGGPCVSLVTGGVIGLNTFGTDVVLDKGAAHLNDLINYFGVVPIDHCLREFPLETDLHLPRDGSSLDWFDAYGLSRKYAEAGSTRAAERLAARVVALRPDLAESHWLQALGKYVAGIEVGQDSGAEALLAELPKIVAAFEGVLRIDPDYAAASLMLANIHVVIGKPAEARAHADRALRSTPEDWQAHQMRGRVALAEKDYGLAVQCAARAKALSGAVLPDPYVLAGQAHYANKAFDVGRAEYEAAARLHSANLEARMGVAAYHDLQQRTDEAVAAYRTILDDFRDNAVVLAAIGRCFYAAKRYPEAVREFDSALQRFEQTSQAPPPDMLYSMGDALLQQKESASAAHVFSLFLSYYPTGAGVAEVHIQSASIWHGAGHHGLAAAHLRAAKALTQDEKAKAQLAEMQLGPLSLEEIEQMMKVRYPLDVVHLLIRISPLTFAIRSEEDVMKLHREKGLPGPLIEAIVESNKEHGVQAGGGQGLAGTWVTQGQLQDGTRYRIVAEYSADRFNVETSANGQRVSVVTGSYKVENGVILARTDEGYQERYPFELRNGQLLVQMPGVGTMTFERAK